MKSNTILIVGLLLLTSALNSCVKTDLTNAGNEKMIGFSNNYLTNANITQGSVFNITGYKSDTSLFIPSTTYTIGTGFDGGQEYSFDGNAASNYHFYAYAINANNTLSAAATATYADKKITFATNTAANQDLVCAYSSYKGDNTNQSSMSFYHALAKVNFKIRHSSSASNTLVITKLEYTVKHSQADFALEDGSISRLGGDSRTYTLTGNVTVPAAPAVATSYPDEASCLYVIPQTIGEGSSLKITYTINGNEPQVKTVPTLATTLKQGVNTQYSISFTPDNQLKLSIDVEDWLEESIELEPEDTSILYQAQNLRIASGEGGEIPKEQFDKLKTMEEGTIIVQYMTSTSGLQSLFGIGDNRAGASHFNLYINGSKIGFETRGAGDISGSGNTTRQPRQLQTVALKAEKGVGYKIFANGKLIMDKPFIGSNYKFISSLPNLNSAFVGKTPRVAVGNAYLYSGNIEFINIFNRLLSDQELAEITNVTPIPETFVPVRRFDMFYNGDQTASEWFRIPSLLTLKSGTVLASIDARFGGTTDSPNNLDNVLRRSTDGGRSFASPTFPLNFLDYPNAAGFKTWSASFIDPIMMQDKRSGRVYMMLDAWPWGGGNVTRNGCHVGSGLKTINGKKYLALTNVAVPTDKTQADKNMADFKFTIRENGIIWDDVANVPTEYSVNGKFEVMQNGTPLTVKQQVNNSVDVPMNIYFERSIFRVFRTSYIWIIHSDDEGQTWSDPMNINYLKKENEKYFIAAPGNSIQIQKGQYAGRLLFPIYFSGNREQCAAIYSDDQGQTWQRGETPALSPGVNKMSESQFVELPDGSVALFARNQNKGMIGCAISKDGGATFGPSFTLPLQNAGNSGCQISAINLSKPIDGFPAVAVSFANYPDSRKEGTIAIGLIKESGSTYTFDWKYQRLVSPGDYSYSCLSELPNGNLGLFFEGASLQKIEFMEIDIKTLLQ